MTAPVAQLEIVLASPRGFCAGVDRAITIVERALELYGAPIYVRHEIVHNPHVVQRLADEGAIFVEELDFVPEDAHVIFSAHGVSPTVVAHAKKRSLDILDATCPLVTKVHREAQRYSKKGYTIILIGHKNHVEVVGTVGEAPEHILVVGNEEEARSLKIPGNPENIAYLTQTTLSLDDTAQIIRILRERFPHIEGPSREDICYATQNRQNAIKALAEEVDSILVVGAQNSSNTLRLVEVAQSTGVVARRIESEAELCQQDIHEVQKIGITAGASAPEDIVQGIIKKLQKLSKSSIVRKLRITEEDITFALPSRLRTE